MGLRLVDNLARAGLNLSFRLRAPMAVFGQARPLPPASQQARAGAGGDGVGVEYAGELATTQRGTHLLEVRGPKRMGAEGSGGDLIFIRSGGGGERRGIYPERRRRGAERNLFGAEAEGGGGDGTHLL